MEAKRTGKRKERKSKQKRTFYIVLTVLSVLAVLSAALVVGLALYDKMINTDTFYFGIYIDGESMEGLTQEQAIEKLTEIHNVTALEQFKIRLIHNDKEWVLDKNQMNIENNIVQAVEDSYRIGRQGNLLNRIKEINKLKDKPVYTETTISYDPEDLLPHIDTIAAELKVGAIDAAMSFFPDKKEKFVITKEKSGEKLNTEKLFDDIKNALSNGAYETTLSLELEEIKPKITTSDYKGKTEKLVSFGTDLSKSAADRTHNVVKAASEFNGLTVLPGEIISFNEIVGERRADRGYKSAPMIVADKSLQNAVGGGVSQTSSTLYNAAIRAGLKVVEFRRHSFPIAYLEKGLDTTVNLPSPVIDLKVKNTKDTPIYIRTFYADKKVYFEIYGEPLPNNRKISITTDVYEVVPPPKTQIVQDINARYVVYKDQSYPHVLPKNGYKVKVYREILEDGKVIDKELLDDHYYRPIAGIKYVGVKSRPEE